MKAFPNGIITNKDGLIVGGQDGMDLRDYFAAKAMQSQIDGFLLLSIKDANLKVAERAYEMADAMMEARSK